MSKLILRLRPQDGPPYRHNDKSRRYTWQYTMDHFYKNNSSFGEGITIIKSDLVASGYCFGFKAIPEHMGYKVTVKGDNNEDSGGAT